MNTEELVYRNNEDSFKEIEIRDLADGKNIEYVPNGKPKNSEIVMSPTLNSVAIVAICERDVKFSQVIQFGKFLRWVSAIEFFTVFTYLILGLVFFLFLLVFPILGFFAAKKIYKPFGVVYLMYLIGSILLRIILMATFAYLPFIIVGSFAVVFNLICIRFLVRFLKIVKELSPEDRAELLILQNGVPARRNNLND